MSSSIQCQLLVQSCLCAPPMVADEAKPLFSPNFFFSFSFFLRLLLFAHFGEIPVAENLFPTIFYYMQKNICFRNFYFLRKKLIFGPFFSFLRPVFDHGRLGHPQSPEFFSFFFFSLSVFCFWPTSGKLPCVKICFPQYFAITRRYMQKKIFLLR